jgi:hypothetical protein
MLNFGCSVDWQISIGRQRDAAGMTSHPVDDRALAFQPG